MTIGRAVVRGRLGGRGERGVAILPRRLGRCAARGYDGGRPRFTPPSIMLVSCVAYENGRKLADIPVADISEYVHRPDSLVWVALFEPTQAELDEMAQEFDLHELAVEDARK